MRSLNRLKWLHAFEAAARHGSFTGAFGGGDHRLAGADDELADGALKSLLRRP